MSKKSAERSRAQRAQDAMQAQQRQERRRQMLVVGGIVVAIVAIVGTLFAVNAMRDTTGESESSVPQASSSEGPGGAAVDGYTVTVGEASAPTTIALYEDLQCPVCAVFESMTGDAVRQAIDDGKVKVEYHMVAFLDDASTTDYSSRALNALMVVLDTAGTEAYLDYHELLYANQPAEGTAGLTDDQLIEYAVEAGADEDAVRGPIEDNQFHQWVVNATDQMSQDGVNGTPTAFIDGKQAGANPQEAAEAVLDAVQ